MSRLIRKLKHRMGLSQKKTVVFILSSMRAGSSLLKALLANAPDTSFLPEINFNRYRDQPWELQSLSPAKIIVVKKPAWYKEINYPKLPVVKNSKKIFLVRDAYETVLSLHAMNQEHGAELVAEWPLDRLLNEYWYNVYQGMLKHELLQDQHTIFVKYEELTKDPLRVTKSLFDFIGSSMKEGVDTYPKPKSYDWKWGLGDGGEKIKTQRVQYLPKARLNNELLELINSSEKISQLRSELGYIL